MAKASLARIKMNLKQILFSIFGLVLMGGSVSAQTMFRLLDEIQAVPTSKNLVGEWTIGGNKIVVDQATKMILTHPAKVGALVEAIVVIKANKPVALQIQPQSQMASDVFDGPYVFWKDAKTAEVLTIEGGKLNRQVYENIEKPKTIIVKGLPVAERTIVLDPGEPTPPKSVWDAPSRLMAISDLEGNYSNALRFLQNNKVLDDDGHWKWGDGHLVLIGDLVDRGPMVTETMWMIRRLEREAKKAGGKVHYVLGNHEAMVMGGDLRYIHPRYHFISQRLGKRYNELYGETTEIGRWWRSKNGVETIGDLLFVHGGYSPLLDKAKLNPDELNDRIRAGLPPNRPTGATAATNPVLHQHGPFWYRGYFAEHAAGWGGKASTSEVQQILDRHKVNHIVVGHTVVKQVGPIDQSSQVIGIDIDWKTSSKCEGLLMEGGQLFRVTMTAEKKELELNETNKK